MIREPRKFVDAEGDVSIDKTRRGVHRAEVWAPAGSVVAAIGASACCWLPLLLLAFGLSAGGVAGFFEKVRPFFLGAAAIFLGSGFYLTYFRKPACEPGDACAAPNPRLVQFNRVVLWVATVFVIAFALFPYYSPAVVRMVAGAPDASVGSDLEAGRQSVGQQVTRVFQIKGMTCSGCAAMLEVALAKLTGVIDVRVSFDEEKATIRSVSSGMPTAEAIRAEVERSGFKLNEGNDHTKS